MHPISALWFLCAWHVRPMQGELVVYCDGQRTPLRPVAPGEDASVDLLDV